VNEGARLGSWVNLPTVKHDNRGKRKPPSGGVAGWWYIVGGFWTTVVVSTVMYWALK